LLLAVGSCALSLFFLPASALERPGGSSTRFQLPPGFVIECVAAPPLVEHPMMACFDERGRLFIAESAGQNLKADDLRKTLPNFIRVLEPADDRGVFRKGHIFADKLTFPMGVLWHDGSLFAASSGGLWRLDDTRGTGVADQRQELVTKFGYTGNAADIHGPFLGPDGRLYWCDGRHGHEIQRPDGTMMRGKAARIFRSRPDGRDIEVVCGGGMDNPVEIAFTSEGEPFVTVNILHNKPARNDGIIYAIEGGNYPWHDVYKEFPRTGDLLPAVANLGWVAPSGLTRYRSDAFGGDYRNNLFSAQFNRSRIQRHIVERDGAGFRIKTEDFLTSSDKNFHPTDVLEDADGSLLVVDTGGWFRIGCPTSKIAQPEIKGAIYRIRPQNASAPPDPRGLRIAWASMTPEGLTRLLDDPRFVVRDRAIHLLAKQGNAALSALKAVLGKSTSSRACRNAVWALTRIDSPESRPLVRQMLSDKDLGVRLAATHAVALNRDDKAASKLLTMVVKDEPAVRREAAAALGRLGQPDTTPALMEAVRAGEDRFLEHSLIHALIVIQDRDGVARYLREPSPVLRRAALIALDQMKEGNLTREQVTPLLETTDPALLRTALAIVAERPAWGKEIVGLLDDWLARPELEKSRQASLRGLLHGLNKDPAVQEAVARALADPRTSTAARILALDAMTLPKLPPSWVRELGRALEHREPAVVQQAIVSIRSAGMRDFDKALLEVAQTKSRPAEVRLAAFAAAAARVRNVQPETFALLLDQLDKDRPPLTRLAAANALSQAGLSLPQLEALAPLAARAGSLELAPLLTAFEKGVDVLRDQPQVTSKLIAGLHTAPGLAGLTPGNLQNVFAKYSPDIRAEADKLVQKLQGDAGKQKEKLAELEPLLKEGDADRGRLVFFGTKASCSACHPIKGAGGQIGPDLTTIGAIRSGRDLLEAVIFPSTSFARGYEPYVVETSDGKTHTGVLGRETADAVYLITTERAEVRVPREAIEALVPSRVSIMPQGLDAQLSRQELGDLLAYMQSLR
jgi:putative membrane-bound dehydrogenase-like protein